MRFVLHMYVKVTSQLYCFIEAMSDIPEGNSEEIKILKPLLAELKEISFKPLSYGTALVRHYILGPICWVKRDCVSHLHESWVIECHTFLNVYISSYFGSSKKSHTPKDV